MIFDLYSKGYKTKTGNSFKKNSLYELLCNEKYTGVYTFNLTSSKDYLSNSRNNHLKKPDDNVIRIDGGVPQIVDTDTFQAVKKRMEANKKRPASNNGKEFYLLSGKVYCKCSYAMSGNTRFYEKEHRYRHTACYLCSCRYNSFKILGGVKSYGM